MTCYTCKTTIDARHACSWTDGTRDYCSEECARSPHAVPAGKP